MHRGGPTMTADADLLPATPSQWDFIDALGDGVYGVDLQGHCTFANRAAIRILGYAAATDLIGRNMHALIHHTRPDGSAYPQSECPLLHTATSGHPVRLENEMLWRRDGTPFYAEYSSFPVISQGVVTGSVVTFNDTSVRQDAQKRLAVQHAVSQVSAGDGTPETLPIRILEAICAGLGWDIGLFWRRQESAPGHEVMCCVADWRSHDAGARRAVRHGQPRHAVGDGGRAAGPGLDHGDGGPRGRPVAGHAQPAAKAGGRLRLA